MVELINITDSDRDTIDQSAFNDRAKEIVSEISQFAEGRNLYQENKERSEGFFPEGTTVSQIFCYILDRIVNAPTSVYRDASVLLLMPALKKALDNADGIYTRGGETHGESDSEQG